MYKCFANVLYATFFIVFVVFGYRFVILFYCNIVLLLSSRRSR